ncbi:MAG TPA: hypothetical protein VFC18_17150 [Burkholderiales bacterium]|nr:hypothetical protein [Burkholderiales bacterium]
MAYALIARWLVFAVAPWGVLMLAVMAWWISWYFLAPLLFPFTAYMGSTAEQSIFSPERMGWHINAAYSILVATAATWLGRAVTFPKAIALYLGTLVGIALAVHAAMLMLGYHYWYDTP